MPNDEVRGAKVESQRRLTFLDLGAFSANATASPAARMGCPPGVKGIRIIGIHVLGSSIPSDPDGTMLLNVLVFDASEAGDDTIISSEDLESLLLVANQFYEATLAAETAEVQNTLYPGDSLRATLVNNSAGITTNPNVTLCVEWHPVPDEDELERVGRASDYQP